MKLIQSSVFQINNNNQYVAFTILCKSKDSYFSTIEICSHIENSKADKLSKPITKIELTIYNPVSEKKAKLVEEEVAVGVLSILTERTN